MLSPLSYFRTIRHRHRALEDLYHRAIRAADRVITSGHSNRALATELNLMIAQRREFIRIKQHYQQVLAQLGWFEWHLYRKTIRRQVRGLSGLSNATTKKINSYKNFWNNAPEEHINLSLLPTL